MDIDIHIIDKLPTSGLVVLHVSLKTNLTVYLLRNKALKTFLLLNRLKRMIIISGKMETVVLCIRIKYTSQSFTYTNTNCSEKLYRSNTDNFFMIYVLHLGNLI